MTRNRRRSRSSRSKSPSLSPDRRRGDDIEAQMGAVDSPNTGSKQKAASIASTTSFAHKAPKTVPPDTSLDGAPSPENQLPPDNPKAQSRTRLARIVNEGDPLQVTNPASIPLPASVEDLSQQSRPNSESASRSSAPHITAGDNEEAPLSRHAASRSPGADDDRGSARNERSASPARPRSPTASQKEPEKKGSMEDSTDPWTECAKRVWDYEKNRVDKWKEDINNLLLFSGLFSTVLTGFIVPYYVILQMQQASASAQTLMFTSSLFVAVPGRLNELANGAVHFSITQPIIHSTATSSPAQPTSRIAVSVCTLSFTALVCSLGAASMGIAVSQWLQHHGDKTTSTSRQSIRIWYFRDRGFVQWKVQDIINTLPLLLQLSVALFLIGLVELLWTMNFVVAGVVTVLVLALLAFSVGTAIIPAFAPKCPYKSPQAWWCLLILHWLTKHLEHVSFFKKHFGEVLLDPSNIFGPPIRYVTSGYLLRHMWHSIGLPLDTANFRTNMPNFSVWRDLEYFLVRAQAEKDEGKLKMMVHADEILTDETSLPDIISPCVTESDLDAALPAFYAIMQRRAHETTPSDDPNQPELIWHPVDSDGQLVIALGDMAVNMFARVTNANVYYGDRKAEQLHILKILDKLLRVMPRTQPGAEVYLRLCALADPARLSDDVRKNLAELIVVRYYYQFRHNIRDIRPTLLAISLCKDLDPFNFSRGVHWILRHSAKLPRAEIGGIHDELRGALAAVAEYFGRPDAAALADRLTQGHSWDGFWFVSGACVALAKVNHGLFTPEIVDALGQFSLLCPDGNSWNEDIRDHMKALRELTGLPPHPEVAPAVDSQSSSATDS